MSLRQLQTDLAEQSATEAACLEKLLRSLTTALHAPSFLHAASTGAVWQLAHASPSLAIATVGLHLHSRLRDGHLEYLIGPLESR
jgi:hypothetical protein